MSLRPAAFLALTLAAAPAAALEKEDFAWGWQLELPAGSAFQLELPPEVHEVLATDDQRDLAVFDGRGAPMPLARYQPPPREAAERRVPVPVFSLKRPAGSEALDALVHVERGPDGSLRRIEAGVAGAGAGGANATDHLLDLSRLEEAIDGLALTWSETGDVRARFAVEASADLEHWRELVGGATVVALGAGDARLERRRIEIPATRARYLRLQALDETALGRLRVEAIVAGADPGPALRWVEARHVEKDAQGRMIYEAAGAFDVRAVRVVPQGRRSLADLQLRGAGDGVWIDRARLTLVRLEGAGAPVVADEARVLPGARSRRWQLVADPPLDVAPRLLLGTLPDRFAFLAEGEAPYFLAAGSGRARRGDAPVGAALEAIARREGERWEPPLARLGGRIVLGGEEALQPGRRPLPWPTILLWAVLIAGALLVGALAWRLLHTGAEGAGTGT